MGFVFRKRRAERSPASTTLTARGAVSVLIDARQKLSEWGCDMLTLTREYALRAMVYLAWHVDEQPITGRRTAEQARIPVKHLSHILGYPVHSGVLESPRGRNGGFRLRHPAKQIVLYDVVAPFERFDHGRCPFGNQESRRATLPVPQAVEECD